MGEYLSKKIGNKIVKFAKAGVMDEMFYIRRNELVKWAPYDEGKGTKIYKILNNDTTFYRFPWPDEDNQDITCINTRDPFKAIHIDLIKTNLADDNYCYECASSKVNINSEKYVDGITYTVFECDECESNFHYKDLESIDRIKEYLNNTGNSYNKKIADRLLANNKSNQ